MAFADISGWMWRLGYNYDRLVPEIHFQGIVHPKHFGAVVTTVRTNSDNLLKTSAFRCAFDRNIANFRELLLLSESVFANSEEKVLTLGHEFTRLQFLFGSGITLSSSENGEISVFMLGSANEAMASLATVLFNESIAIGQPYTIHGRVVYYFVKPSINASVELMQQMLARADDSLHDVNITFHPVHIALDIVKFVDVRIVSNHTTINIRHGSPVDSERERVSRHTKQRTIDVAWDIERERVRNKKTTINKWTIAQEEELISKGRVQGMVGEYIRNIIEYPELADSPQNIRIVPVNR